MHRRFATLAAAAAALSTQPVLAAPIAVYTGGFLTGVTNLETSIGAFNVTWQLGTCADAFGSTACSFGTSTGFQFNKADALEVTKGLNSFMSTMDKTLLPGYTPATGNSLTSIATPYGMREDFLPIGNRKVGESVLTYITNGLGRDNDNGLGSVAAFRQATRYTFASYTPYIAPASVPEPSSWLLVGLGLGGLALAGRKRTSTPGTASTASV